MGKFLETKQKLEKVVKFSEDMDSYKDAVFKIEAECYNKINKITEMAKAENVSIEVKIGYTISLAVSKFTGIYSRCNYSHTYERNTTYKKGFLWWYELRDALHYYFFSTATVKNNTIKFSVRDNPVNWSDDDILQEYKNGKTVVKVDSETLAEFEAIRIMLDALHKKLMGR